MPVDPALVDHVAAQLARDSISIVAALEPNGATTELLPALHRERIRRSARALIQEVARTVAPNRNEVPEILKAGSGAKPRLSGAQPPFLFNISHSGGLWACAFSRSREIGIDVESSPFRVLDDRHLSRFLHHRERGDLARWLVAATSLGAPAPVILWTLKEAALKWSGRIDGSLLNRMRDVFVHAPGMPSGSNTQARFATGSIDPLPTLATTATVGGPDGERRLMLHTTSIPTPAGRAVVSWCLDGEGAAGDPAVFVTW